MADSKEKIKHVPKADNPNAEILVHKQPETMAESTRNDKRQEIAYLQMLMRRYPGPTERFYNESKSA